MPHPREEIEATMQRYVAVRENIDAGDGTWRDLAQFFTDDAVFIDPAWGRVEGIDEMKATVFGDAMVGLEEWKFPIEFYADRRRQRRRQVEADAARRPRRRHGRGSNRACRR